MMRLAIQRAPSFRRLVTGVRLPRLSGARAAAVLMMLLTDRHYRVYAHGAASSSPSAPRRFVAMVVESLPAIVSSRWADRVLLRVERGLMATV